MSVTRRLDYVTHMLTNHGLQVNGSWFVLSLACVYLLLIMIGICIVANILITLPSSTLRMIDAISCNLFIIKDIFQV